MQSLRLYKVLILMCFAHVRFLPAGSVHFSAWTMSLTRVQDVAVQDIHKRKKPRKHYVSSSVLSLVLWQSPPYPFIAPYKGTQGSLGFWDCQPWFPDTIFRSLYSGTLISDSIFSGIRISETENLGFHKQIFSDSGIWIPESGIRIPLREATLNFIADSQGE